MRLAVLTRYGPLGASSRLRMMQFSPVLRALGIEPGFQPLFDDAYLERLYRGGSRLGPALRAYARRLSDLRKVRSADLIWLEKEALPWVPATFECALLPKDVPLVTDYDDAIFHRYDMHHRSVVRWFLGHKIDCVMKVSDLVMAGNAYLADRARSAGARRVEIVPTVVDTERYRVRPPPAPGSPPIIGWIGSPSTWRDYLLPMMPCIIDVAEKTGARIRIVGSGAPKDFHPLVDVIAWREDEEVTQIQQMDIGIMPLDDSPWARGKCGYKLIQYMACGVPVVASPVGVNSEIVEEGINGFLARDDQEWRSALTTLLRDHQLRRRMGNAGRRRIEERYSLEVWAPRVAELLLEAGRSG